MSCGGTGKWSRAGVPHKGWECIDVEDLESDRATCEMCEVAEMRFVHTMKHPGYGTLRVGCICAGNMEGDYVGAVAREAAVKGRRGWLDRRWRVSAKGNEFLNTRDGFNVVVYPLRDGGWAARILDRRKDAVIGTIGKKFRCATSDDAKVACLQVIEGVKAEQGTR